MLTHITGILDIASGNVPTGVISSSSYGLAYANLFFTGVRGGVSGLGTRFFINHSVLAYFGPGEQINVSYNVSGDTISGTPGLMLTGYFVNLP